MSSRLRTGSLAVLCLLLLASVGSAQQRRRGLVEVSDAVRHGFWLSLGVGVGAESFAVGDGDDYSESLQKPFVSLKLGGTPSRRFRLGGEVSSWINENDGATESLTSFMAIGQLYPFERAGLFVKGGLGLGRDAVDFDRGGEIAEVGVAGSLGAGWEVAVSRRVFLTPTVEAIWHHYDQRSGADYRERVVHVGLGVVIQPGR